MIRVASTSPSEYHCCKPLLAVVGYLKCGVHLSTYIPRGLLRVYVSRTRKMKAYDGEGGYEDEGPGVGREHHGRLPAADAGAGGRPGEDARQCCASVGAAVDHGNAVTQN